ncbi:hypothetical protein [Butyrivibrio sp. AE3009]|uniref:hypothetical protein n=1 Tax=Butyrivibrio sp. AE3009 TaxID=1280666 RepID=UPI0003B78558|nr:hypothetical protein [Butyrivibrio sp. AE3009]
MNKSRGPIIVAVIATVLILGVAGWVFSVHFITGLMAKGHQDKDEDVYAKSQAIESASLPEVLGEVKEETDTDETKEEADKLTESEEESEGNEGLTPSANRKEVDTSDFYAISMGNYSYQLPQKVSDFLEDGWTFMGDDKPSDTLSGDQQTIFFFYTPESSYGHITVSIKNFSLDEQQLKDCYVVVIEAEERQVEDMGLTTVCDGNIVMGSSTVADVKSKYGEPDETKGESTYYYYGQDSHELDSLEEYVEFDFSDEGIVNSIIVKNVMKPDGIEDGEVNTEAPEYLGRYEAPAELGDDLFSGNFMVSKVIHNLPCPLQTFTDNKWKYDYDEDTVIGAGQGALIILTKGELVIYATVGNFDDKACLLKNTMVTDIDFHTFDVKMEFPGGLSTDTTKDEFEAYLKEHNITNYDYDESRDSYFLPYDQSETERHLFESGMTFVFSDGKMFEVTMKNYGWLAD